MLKIPAFRRRPCIPRVVVDHLGREGALQYITPLVKTSVGFKSGPHFVLIHGMNIIVISVLVPCFKVAFSSQGMQIVPVIGILVQNPCRVSPVLGWCPKKIRFQIAGKRICGVIFIESANLIAIEIKTDFVGGVRFPFLVYRGVPAEIVCLVVQLELSLRQPMIHRGITVGDVALQASKTAKQVHTSRPLRP